MSKWEIGIVWLVIVAICVVVWTAPKYARWEGKRLSYEKAKEMKHFRHAAFFVNWSIVLQRVIIIVLVGIGLILPGRRVKNRAVDI